MSTTADWMHAEIQRRRTADEAAQAERHRAAEAKAIVQRLADPAASWWAITLTNGYLTAGAERITLQTDTPTVIPSELLRQSFTEHHPDGIGFPVAMQRVKKLVEVGDLTHRRPCAGKGKRVHTYRLAPLPFLRASFTKATGLSFTTKE